MKSGRCRSRFPSPDPVRPGHRAPVVRRRCRRTGSGGSCGRSSEVYSRCRVRLRRQVQPGALLLGRLRSGGHAVLGPARAAARGPRVHARGLLPRGDQPRVLARQRILPGALLLRVCRAGARRLREARPRPDAAYYHHELGEFILPYEAVRTSEDPEARSARSWSRRTSTGRRSPAGTARLSKRTAALLRRPREARTWAVSSVLRSPCDEAAAFAGTPDARAFGAGRWVLAASILGSSMAFIDGTAVNVALPALQTALHATIARSSGWSSRTRCSSRRSCSRAGRSATSYGPPAVFAAGVALRARLGVVRPRPERRPAHRGAGDAGRGRALLVPGSLALISASFPTRSAAARSARGPAFTAITAAIGPVLGGWLVEHQSWRWVFFLNVPLAAVVAALTSLRVPECGSGGGAPRADWLGAALAAAGARRVVCGADRVRRRCAAASGRRRSRRSCWSRSAPPRRCCRSTSSARARSSAPTS